MFCTSGLHDLDGHVSVQIQLPLLTATLVLQREPGIVVVVGAKIVMQLIQSLSMQTHSTSRVLKRIDDVFPIIGLTLSQTES